jgi:hypothetical protein
MLPLERFVHEQAGEPMPKMTVVGGPNRIPMYKDNCATAWPCMLQAAGFGCALAVENTDKEQWKETKQRSVC